MKVIKNPIDDFESLEGKTIIVKVRLFSKGIFSIIFWERLI